MAFLSNLFELSLESAPWLVLGLVLGGVIKYWIPLEALKKHLSQNSLTSIFKAALLGAPLPLCSCGVVPAAVGLRQAGASKPATVSFLISTPETGVDSLSITYALLGPVMAVARLMSAIVSAVVAGFLVLLFDKETSQTHPRACDETTASTFNVSSNGSQGCGEKAFQPENTVSEPSCCSSQHAPDATKSLWQKTRESLQYAFTDMWADIVFWLVIGLVFAALVQTFVPKDFLAQWGSGWLAMVVIILISVPMYVCATASTPMAVGLILAGVSPGVALVFLLAGPATNIGTLGIVAKLLGRKTMLLYVIGTVVTAVTAGGLLDLFLKNTGVMLPISSAADHATLPFWIQMSALLILVAATVWHYRPKRDPNAKENNCSQCH